MGKGAGGAGPQSSGSYLWIALPWNSKWPWRFREQLREGGQGLRALEFSDPPVQGQSS